MFISVAVSCHVLRLVNVLLHDDYSHRAFLFATHLRIDSLMFGVLLSYLWSYGSLRTLADRIGPSILLAAGGIFLAPAFVFPLETHWAVSVLGVVAFYAGSGAILLAAVRLEGSDNRLLKAMGTTGAASYSIYLWHMPVMYWGWRLVQRLTAIESYHAYLVFCVVCTLLVGMLMNRLVEWPVLKIRERILPPPKGVSPEIIPLTRDGR